MTDPRMQTHYDRTGQTGASLRAHLLGVVHDRLDVNPGDRCDLCYSDHPCNCPDEWAEDLLAAIERWEFHAGPKPWETRVGPKVIPDPDVIADTVFDHAMGDEGAGLFCGCGWEPVNPDGFEDWCMHVAAEIARALTAHAQGRPEGPTAAEQPAPAAVGTPSAPGPPEGRYADALHLLSVVDAIKATGGAVEIRGVRIEPCDTYGQTDTTRRADEAARRAREAETLLRDLTSKLGNGATAETIFEEWQRAAPDGDTLPLALLDSLQPGDRATFTRRDDGGLSASVGPANDDRDTLARVQALLDRWNDDWEDGRPIDLKCIDELEDALHPPSRWRVGKVTWSDTGTGWEASNGTDVHTFATQAEALAYADRKARGQA